MPEGGGRTAGRGGRGTGGDEGTGSAVTERQNLLLDGMRRHGRASVDELPHGLRVPDPVVRRGEPAGRAGSAP
ncbi:hypothetical protein B7R87_02140 [Streptomyces tsukubensis]|uniref:Uncharacterized protein n=1 Tax=Streptomyces tsukubensis (strain DSM 42081 / NBRC 108919 / NRRL 18488 / 9993) TaxID=1114943 RepID=I2MU21_STRT9|nr:hypothetical protein B7R87_02140 [Streptomyces tsukubensis]EIF88268.1 hypothetical protein [Streptomyces tsukubensis NRRL18488]QKM71021.1 hypothetical protein STSU_031690 [Streptomyces tsukubensis NRRL18488]